MNTKKRSEILLKVLYKVYDKYPATREFIDTSIKNICKDKNVYFLYWFTFLYCCLYFMTCCF